SATKVQAFGTAGGAGAGGAVTISLVNSAVSASGVGSTGIFAQSDGTTGTGKIQISIDQNSQVQGGPRDPNLKELVPAAVWLVGGTANLITNAGTIRDNGTAAERIAILTNSSGSNTTVHNTGSIFGDIIFGKGAAGLVDNRVGGVIDAPTTLDLSGGLLRNAGTLYVGGAGTIGKTTLTGDLVQS